MGHPIAFQVFRYAILSKPRQGKSAESVKNDNGRAADANDAYAVVTDYLEHRESPGRESRTNKSVAAQIAGRSLRSQRLYHIHPRRTRRRQH